MTNEEKIYNLLKLIINKLNENNEFNHRYNDYRARVIRYYDPTSLTERYRFILSYRGIIIIRINQIDEKYEVSTMCYSFQILDKDILDMTYFEYILRYDKITPIMDGLLYEVILDNHTIYNFIDNLE